MSPKTTMELVLDCAEPERLMEFWRAALGYRVFYSKPEFAVLVPTEGSAAPLVLQQVPEPKAAKNRMHLDLVSSDVGAEVGRLEALGARRLHDDERSIGDVHWVTLADPEGNEFCVCSGIDW